MRKTKLGVFYFVIMTISHCKFSLKNRSVPVGVNELFCYIIKKVPACISEGALKETECNAAHVIGLERMKCMFWLQPIKMTWRHKTEKHFMCYA